MSSERNAFGRVVMFPQGRTNDTDEMIRSHMIETIHSFTPPVASSPVARAPS